ncbi:MAG: hypothetical protein HY043_05155 [Verrucomicrobia bacterium]|nr:hypothetical protein [Verrucomicrobiota bacterium]
MESYGLLIGLALLALVTTTAILLGRKANAGVKSFREERHENFLRRKS